MNYIHFINHTIYYPKINYRETASDIPEVSKNDPSWKQTAYRIAHISYPFFLLYPPLNKVASTWMATTRTLHHFSSFSKELFEKKYISSFYFFYKTCFALTSFCTFFTYFPLATLLSSIDDEIELCLALSFCVYKKDYEKSLQKIFLLFSNTSYLLFLTKGSLEGLFFFTIFQAISCFFEAIQEKRAEKNPEAFFKIMMGSFRIFQSYHCYQEILRRDFLLSLHSFAPLFQAISDARNSYHLIDHPLENLKKKIEEKNVCLEDFEFGAHFHELGKELVNHQNLSFQIKKQAGQELIELDFKINHPFREELFSTIKHLQRLDPKTVQEILSLMQAHATKIEVKDHESMPLGKKEKGEAIELSLEGIGSILLGTSDEFLNMYERVLVRIDAKKSLYDLHELLSFANCQKTLFVSSKEDIERLKLAHLFHNFFPKSATPFERTKEFFFLPLEQLKEKMIALEPDLKNILSAYDPHLEKEEIFPGKINYRIKGLASLLKEKGASFLTSAITGGNLDTEKYERIASMLKLGIISSEMKAKASLGCKGLGYEVDFKTGGADRTFWQMITQKDIDEELPFDSLAYNGDHRLIISLDALETGSYQYLEDSYGNRVLPLTDHWKKMLTTFSFWGIENYSDRLGILDFVDRLLNREPSTSFYDDDWPCHPYQGHELMLKERIAPKYFEAIVCSDEKSKNELLDYLRNKNLFQIDTQGNEIILGKAIEQFFIVSKNFKEVKTRIEK